MPERIEIGIIPHDTRHEETIIQIANTLDNLQLAVTHVFQSIDDRISGYSKRLSIVKNKASKLQDQLHYLQTNLSLKATKMYSDAKYPAFSTYKEYETIIKNLPTNVTKSQGTIEKSESPGMLSDNRRSNHAAKDDHWVGEANLQDKLQFYYVMGKPLKKTSWPEQDDNHLVSQASSISALLLTDVEKGERPSQLPTIISNTTRLEDAPDSIVQPWNSIDFESPSYLYAPALGEVPQINVPPTLPDLPGIVDDERFTLDLRFQSPIAPSSVVTTPTVRIDLPDTNENKFGIMGMSENAPKLPDVTDDSSSIELANPPPPPPPVAHPAQETLTNVSGKMETNQQSSIPPTTVLPPPPPPPPPVPPPPPPPPPPSSSEPEAMESQSKEQKPIEKKIIPPVDDRTNLMAAIRAAGGIGKAKLKNAAAAEKPADRWSSASVGGDLMADLHAKLSLRRKGIAGASMPPAMERISRLIPPPPKANEASASDRNSATSEYDSQPDVDDWEE